MFGPISLEAVAQFGWVPVVLVLVGTLGVIYLMVGRVPRTKK